jgi:hypothetical protein
MPCQSKYSDRSVSEETRERKKNFTRAPAKDPERSPS